MTQRDLFHATRTAPARARTSDPASSKRAAASLTLADLRTTQREVLQLYRRLGPMDDRTMIRAARDMGLTQSDSSLRSRRSELSKPNQERVAELVAELVAEYHDRSEPDLTAAEREEVERLARARLAAEGFRAPVYDTGQRTAYAGGRSGVVWDCVENYGPRAD